MEKVDLKGDTVELLIWNALPYHDFSDTFLDKLVKSAVEKKAAALPAPPAMTRRLGPGAFHQVHAGVPRMGTMVDVLENVGKLPTGSVCRFLAKFSLTMFQRM